MYKNYGEASKQLKQEIRRKKKIDKEKLEGKSLIISFTLSIYFVSEWRKTLEMGRSPLSPSIFFQPDRKYIRIMCLFGAKYTS